MLLAVVLAISMAFAWPAVAASRGAAPVAAAAAPDRRVDFNGDDLDDLAVGAPGEDLGVHADAGAVNVQYGSPGGLAGSGQVLTQGTPEAGDGFGAALAKGRFNDDDFIDLAVGAPGEDLGRTIGAGVVTVFYGSASGLAGQGELLQQSNPEVGDAFGATLDSGDFNNDGIADLAVGAPGEDVGAARDAGAVSIFFGADGGLGGRAAVENLFQASPEDGDRFGSALEAAPFGGDPGFDLAVGAPGETVRGAQFAGAVDVFYGTSSGLPAAQSAEFFQNNPEANDGFGSALAAGNFGYEDGTPDLAVGAPGETVGTRQGAGAVSILLGVSGGLAPGGPDIVQGPAAGGNPEAGDQFGFSLATGTFQDSALEDLAIGAPGEDLGALTDTGVIHLQFGTPAGLSFGGFLSQDTQNVPGQAESGDAFGGALAAGHYSSNAGVDDELAVGVPGEDVGSAREAGAVSILRGLVLGSPPSGGQLFTQGRVAGGQPELLDNFGAALA
jgi:hypothetical protein